MTVSLATKGLVGGGGGGGSVAADVWDYALTSITTSGSIGKLLKDSIDAAISSRLSAAAYTAPDNAGIAAIKVETDKIPDIMTGISDLDDMVTVIRQIELGRWKLDKVAKTWTIYDADGTTPIKVFNLKNSTGAPSSDDVYERVPI